MFVLMMIQLAHPIFCTETDVTQPQPALGLTQPVTALSSNDDIDTKRYQYWIGSSGKRYICTAFTPDACPSVTSAVYIAVYRSPDGLVTPLSVGHFSSPFIAGGKNASEFGEALNLGANEIHIHLLADDVYEAEEIADDLQSQIFPLDTPS